jgi:hypothetical protein
MRREIPTGVAITLIVLAILIAGGAVWVLLNRPRVGEGEAPKTFMPKPPYAGQKGATPIQPPPQGK